MSKTFRHKGIEQFFLTGSKAGIQPRHEERLRLQLFTLNRVRTPESMNLPGWQWHALKGELAGHWAVKVNGNWRLTYAFEEGNAILVDYQQTMEMYNPPHPGLLIKDLKGKHTVTAVAKHLGVTRAALSRIINGRAAVSADMALLLQDAFGVDAELWLSMQWARDLWVASQQKREKLERLTPQFKEAA